MFTRQSGEGVKVVVSAGAVPGGVVMGGEVVGVVMFVVCVHGTEGR